MDKNSLQRLIKIEEHSHRIAKEELGLSYVDVESAYYQAKLEILEAQKFTLEEASYVVTALSKMLPEFFMINLNPSYHVQKEFGKV